MTHDTPQPTPALKIGIDARFVGPQGTGLGKYTEKLINNLARIDQKNSYVIFLRKENWDFLDLPKNFTKSLADVPWYSVSEQIKLPGIFQKANLDLLHVPHFNAPVFYKGKFVVTIHDLIHHQFSETSATTKNSVTFKLKRFGYRAVISHAVGKSRRIIVPSNFVKDQVIKNYHVDPKKIAVTYEAAEEEYTQSKVERVPFSDEKRKSKVFTDIGEPFIIYVGNAYPHKNLDRLLDAFKILNTKYTEPCDPKVSNKILNIKLVIVCARDVFAQRLQSKVGEMGLSERVVLTGYLKPQELSTIFKSAQAYVFPTLSEGFGIPGLNAMASGVPVVCSDIPTLKEVYGNAALYFDPGNPEDMAEKIGEVFARDKTRGDLIKKGEGQVNKYSWEKMAKETLKIYESVK